MKPVTTDYRDVNDDRIKFEGKISKHRVILQRSYRSY